MRLLFAFLFLVTSSALSAELDLEKMDAKQLQEYFEQNKKSPTKPVFAEPVGYELSMPTDPGAKFWVLEKKTKAADDRWRTIVTKRIGKTGLVSYSRREYDCLLGQVRYLGSGESWAGMEASKPSKDMGPIVDRSIAYYVGKEICK